MNNKFQFSKLTVLFCVLLAILGCGCAILIPVMESVSIALITASGSIALTAIVWYLKKSQAENTLKIYMSTYKEILELKHQFQEDDLCDEMEENIKNKIDKTIDENIEDATSMIEKQEIG